MPDFSAVYNFVQKHFFYFGSNKKAQLVRLIYEIAKKEKIPFKEIISLEKDCLKPFAVLKKELLTRRFPHLSDLERNKWHFTPLIINADNELRLSRRKKKVAPKNIFIEKEIGRAHV